MGYQSDEAPGLLPDLWEFSHSALRIFTQKPGTETQLFWESFLFSIRHVCCNLMPDGKPYSGAIGAAASCSESAVRANGGQ